MLFRKRLKSASLVCLLALAGSANAAPDFDPGQKTPLVKLKKQVRTIISLVDYMVTAEVSDEDAMAAVPPVEGGLDNARSNQKRKQKLRRNGNSMITDNIAGRWLRKTVNVVKWIQKKYTGSMCQRFGNPIIHDMYDVWGPKFFDNYKEHTYASFIKKLQILDPSEQKAVRGLSDTRLDRPLTSLYLNYAKMRLWVDENLSLCYNEAKIQAIKDDENNKNKKLKGIKRIEGWADNAENKFFKLEKRLCQNINTRLLVRTKPDDNPYFDNPKCQAELFKEKRREKINQEKKAEREEQRRQKAAEKAAKKKNKKNKQ